MGAQNKPKQDERTAVTQAYAILRSLAAGTAYHSDTSNKDLANRDLANKDLTATLRDATRQLTTAMARATAGEAALNDARADAATALSAVSEALAKPALTSQAIARAEAALVALLQAFDRQNKAPERIYVDPTHPATLWHDGEAHECHTLEEAVLDWLHLSEAERKDATIQVNVPNGPLYTAADIDRLHIEAKYQRE